MLQSRSKSPQERLRPSSAKSLCDAKFLHYALAGFAIWVHFGHAWKILFAKPLKLRVLTLYGLNFLSKPPSFCWSTNDMGTTKLPCGEERSEDSLEVMPNTSKLEKFSCCMDAEAHSVSLAFCLPEYGLHPFQQAGRWLCRAAAGHAKEKRPSYRP